MENENNNNLLLAVALSALVIIGWSIFGPKPEQPSEPSLADTPAAELIPQASASTPTTPAQPATPQSATIDAPRIGIETPSLSGSISLAGARLDDLELTGYTETLDTNSPFVRLLSPVGESHPYYALHGWISTDPTADLPGPETVWNVIDGDTLTPSTPITLGWRNAAGLEFTRTISVDDKYMFTIAQTVTNGTNAPVSIAPYGVIAREGEPDTVNFFILHEGVVSMTDGSLHEVDYDDVAGLTEDEAKRDVTEGGWIGFTDKYWMATLIPNTGTPFSARTRHAGDIYRTETIQDAQTLAPGASVQVSERLFAGAKEWATIREYQNAGGVQGFIDSIDWGWFFFFTKPIFYVLHTLNGFIGNMGWSIIALTFFLKALLFPLAYKSYSSMARMRELQPEMEKLRENAGDDREKLQKGMMELYRKNKVNPASGCLPMLVQIPIFFSLYKVIFVTLELRQAPWIGWIRDLSVKDPSSILNFFGMAPWGVPEAGSMLAVISLGILPILLGVSMYLQQKLNPAPADAAQRMVFAWMPWVFMFMLGRFASGLVLYWITNNTITFIQQYLIMRSHGFRPNLIGNILGRSDEAKK